MRKLLRACLTLLVILSHSTLVDAQMLVDTDTLYGNEWINYDQPYYKIPIAKDGLYKLDVNALQAAGVSLDGVTANQLRLLHMGVEVPIHVSTDGALVGGDFLLFWGKQNRGDFDAFLFEDAEENQLNPQYSLVTDTSAYYLTWGSTNASTRWETLETDLTNAPPREQWVWQRTGEIFTEKFMKNYTRRSGITIYFSHYDVAEGYGNRNINELLQSGNTSQDFSLDLPDAFIGGPNARFTSRFGVGEGDHRQIVQIDGGTYFDRTYSGIAVKAPDFSFPLTDDRIDIHYEGQADDRDEQSIAFYQVEYPSVPDAGNQKVFEFEVDGSANPVYLEIADFNSNSGTPIIYDLTNDLRILCQYENGLVKAILPAGTGRRSLVLLEENSANAPGTPKNITFSNLLAQETEFLILTAPELRETYENQDQVQAYADYRASAAGGNYKTQIVEVEDIYHQFGYGLDRHPQSIRNFVHAVHRQWPNLKYVFIIGKGREYPSLRTAEGLANALEAETLFVPSFGFPASDNLMLSNNSSSVGIVPVGRIAAITPKEISIYLRKVEALEATVNNGQTIEERAWMKNIMHLGGGGNSGEQNAIRSNLERMEREIEGNLFGAQVTPFYKTNTDPIQESRSDRIFDRINTGTAVITFFGHSSPGTFDFNIDNPDNYENFGKFPLIMSLGCYSGNFFTSSRGIAERFTFYEDKASVAFGASRGVGFISTLGGFADRFYEKMGGEKYGHGIGDIISATRESFDYLTGLEIKTIVQQFALMGDPAIKLHPSQGPDYTIDASSVTFNPNVISVQEDTFQLEFDLINLGQFIQDSINIVIRQKLPSGDEIKVKTLRIGTPAYGSHQVVRLPNQGKAAVGLNTFFIDIDVDNEVEEFPSSAAELNNSLLRASGQAGVNLYIVDNGLRPVYPKDFALIGNSELELKASTTVALVSERKYIMELDTTPLFDSPLKQRKEVQQKGGVVKWKVELPIDDRQVYYWRVSPDSLAAEIGFVWETRSFTYEADSPEGWSQSDYWQFSENEFEGLEVDSTEEFDFWINGYNVQLYNKTWDRNNQPAFRWNFGSSAASVRPWGFSNFDAGVAMWVGDPVTGRGMANPPGGLYGTVNPSVTTKVFAFPTDTQEQREKLIEFLDEIIPSKSFVVLFTVQRDEDSNYAPEEWAADTLAIGKSIFSVLETQGATKISLLGERGAVPYTFIYRKDDEVLGEDIADTVVDFINTEVNILVNGIDGSMRSPLIGPANNWHQFRSGVKLETGSSDSLYLNLYGLDKNGNEQLLLEQFDIRDTSISFIDAAEIPYIWLEFYTYDGPERTSPDLINWDVLFDGLPDAAVNPNEVFTPETDTLQQGQDFEINLAIENLMPYPMDSLLLKYTLVDDGNNEETSYQRIQALGGEETVIARVGVPGGFGQLQQLIIEVNPDDDQPELYDFNNVVVKDLSVQKDAKPPVLDVTFDGIHILDGDLVSAEPEIVVSLVDENEYLLLSDTSIYKLFLRKPGQQTAESISLNQPWITFNPASAAAEKNQAEITLRPIFTVDGEYELEVLAQDMSGNEAGRIAYSTNFEVITTAAISNVLNYPNPFSTSTQFVYTLTGANVPAEMTIQIMTVSGRIVREISKTELGPLRIGTHRTEYQWDGTDEFGDRLANGVYLYRILATNEDGSSYEKLESSTDKFFKKGFGKLVILR